MNHCLSIPCFLDVRPQYFAAARRIVFVGQETNGWWTEWNGDVASLAVTEITSFYRKARPELLQKYRSPYWRAVREITTGLAIAEPESSIVFSNIFPCDVDKKQAGSELLDAFLIWRVLPDELEVLQPDHVIFFCGPIYSWNLHCYFNSALSGKLSATTPVSYTPADLTWNGFVSYHPHYLRRAGLWRALDQIIHSVSEDMKKSAVKSRTSSDESAVVPKSGDGTNN